MHTLFDEEWLAWLLASRAPLASKAPQSVAAAQDWGGAANVLGFVGRAAELTLLRRWVIEERCRLVAVLGMGGIGKTSLAARLAQEVAPIQAPLLAQSKSRRPGRQHWRLRGHAALHLVA